MSPVFVLSHSVLCDPMNCILPGSSVHGILQAKILQWVAIPFLRGSFQPRDRTRVSWFWAIREAQGMVLVFKTKTGRKGGFLRVSTHYVLSLGPQSKSQGFWLPDSPKKAPLECHQPSPVWRLLPCHQQKNRFFWKQLSVCSFRTVRVADVTKIHAL